ncbi:AAA family ATPase [Photobacterium damselae subsp. damselae]|uniref:ATP-dependent nuclease n=1 Tax=Photobacterium damselae TaxID=38293 RepID=UPI001592DA2D|nr:AAA family ATPase [Photobacterium damselae]NVH50989.1 AAA family ATPase [Photobacterium damselae subsp. damselae]NVO79597.1 AAA family ATPase [Photobacterium damselae subsp. damselae]
MKLAKINDGWDNVNKFKSYRAIVNNVTFSSCASFDDFVIPVNSAITAICGRNGVGKSNLLKSIYSAISGDSSNSPDHLIEDLNAVDVTLTIRGSKKKAERILKLNINSIERLPVDSFYLDPSVFAFETLKAIKVESDIKTLLNGTPKFSLTNEQKEFINKVLGKKYQNIIIHEFKPSSKNKIGDEREEKVFPYIEVTLNGITYSNEFMGSGEHKCLILIWSLLSLEDNSYFFMEEPESFVCPRFQRILMDFISYYSSEKKLTVFLTTHSEHILSSLKTSSIFSLKRKSLHKFMLVNEKDSIKYRKTLGLSSPKSHALLVEDDFAGLFLEELLSYYRHDLLEVCNIHNMGGESNIYEVAKRISSKHDMRFIAVYDADQRGKSVADSMLPSVYLPSKNNLPPEKDIIQYIETNSEYFAYALGIDIDSLDAILAEFTEEHHDWFIELHREFERSIAKINLREFKRKAIFCWISDNKEICDKFIFELDNLGLEFKAELIKLEEGDRLSAKISDHIIYDVVNLTDELKINTVYNFVLDTDSGLESKLRYLP